MSESFEDTLGFHFRKPELLRVALTHKSALSDGKWECCNERLEFLGDSILAAIAAQYLYNLYPDEAEGRLSKRKAAFVSKTSLTQWAKELNLGAHLILGPGEQSSGGRTRSSILSDALEAVIGAIYLDAGYEAAQQVVGRWLERDSAEFKEADHKSRLQEIMHKRYRMPPRYETVSTAGPEHDKTFSVEVRMGKETLGIGAGKSKKEAEQSAAFDALKKLQPRHRI